MNPTQNQNQGGYQGTGQTGTFNGTTYIAPDATNPFGSYKQATPKNNNAETATTVISSANMAPVSPIPLPNQTVSSYGGIPGAVEAVTIQSNTQNANQPTAESNYIKALMESGNISSSVDREAQNSAKKLSDTYTSQLEQEQLALRRNVEALQKNPNGMLSSGIAIETDRLSRDSLSKQADIAILQTAANRNYDTAAAIADRQVAMKLEKSAANLAALKLLDDREFGDITRKKEREYNQQVKNEDIIRNLKLNVAQFAGSSAASIMSKLSAIDTTKPGAYDQAVAIAGKYANDPLDRAIKQAQLNKINADVSETKATAAGGTITPGQKPTGKADYVSAGFANRISEAIPILDDVETKKYTKLWDKEQTTPLRIMRDKDLQRYKQAQDNFLRAVLRKESGAAIGKDEIEGYAPVYFVQPGDSKEVVLQKQRTRVDALNSIIGASGKAYGGAYLAKPETYLGKSFSGTSVIASEDDYLDSVDAVINSTNTLYQNAGFSAY